MAWPTISGPYGLKPVNKLGGTPFAGATRHFAIASGYNTNIFNDFRSNLILQSEIHNYNTRGSSKIRPPFPGLKKCQKSFFHVGISIWNEIPLEIKSANSLPFFKRKLITHLFS